MCKDLVKRRKRHMVIHMLHISRKDLSDQVGTHRRKYFSTRMVGCFQGYKRYNYQVFLGMSDIWNYMGGKYLFHHQRSLANIQLDKAQYHPQQAKRSQNLIYRSNISQHLQVSPHPSMFHTTHRTVNKQVGNFH